jgi:hypothetical protein
VSGLANPHRDAYGLALAWLDDDMARVAALLAPYRLTGAEFELLDLIRLAENPEAFRSLVEGLALAGAGRR